MEQKNFSIPGTYKKKMSVFWWTARANDLRFILRELTSLPVAYTCMIILFLIRSLSKGPMAYSEFLETLKSPVMIILNLVAFAGLLFHSISWFNLAPKAMVVKIGKNTVPGQLIAMANFGGWIIISAIIAWLLI